MNYDNKPQSYYINKFTKNRINSSEVKSAISMCFGVFYNLFKKIESYKESEIISFRAPNPGFQKVSIFVKYNGLIIEIFFRAIENDIEIYMDLSTTKKRHYNLLSILLQGEKHYKFDNLIRVSSIENIFTNTDKVVSKINKLYTCVNK